MSENLLVNAAPEILSASGLLWEHPSRSEPLSGGGLRVWAPPRTDYFRDPEGAFVLDNGPYLGLSVAGDFVARLHVRPAFAGMYDAGGILVRHNPEHWAKLCFEATNFGTTAAISVVTRGVSDDANGPNLSVPDLWLQVCRVGDAFGMHYAVDGMTWRKVRRFHLPLPPTVMVGLLAQSPGDAGASAEFPWFSIERRTVANTRTGV